MKKLILTAFIMLSALQIKAQETYTVDGQSYELKTEISGTIDLLWNVIDSKYRYFIQKENAIAELVNTKNNEGRYNEEYLVTLKAFTSDAHVSYDKVKLTLYNLKDVVNTYNATVDSNYTYSTKKLKVKTRLGFSAGITNTPFVTNPDNELSPLVTAELELYDDDIAKRHAAFLGLRHTLENKNLEYSSTELSLGYRFRFVYCEKFNVYANLKLTTFTWSKSPTITINGANEPVIKKESGNSFDAPVIFGLGADFKIGEKGFLTVSYGELFALSLDSPDNFSTDFSIGYKFKL